MFTANELLIKQHVRDVLSLVAKYSRLKNPMGGHYAYEAGMLSAYMLELAMCRDENSKIRLLESQVKWLSMSIAEMEKTNAV